MGFRIQLASPDLDPSVLQSLYDCIENAAQAKLGSERGLDAPGWFFFFFDILV